MKQITFDDRYGLTDLVLSGQKTQTFMLVETNEEFLDGEFNWDSAGTMITFCRDEKEFIDIESPFHFGEELSVTIYKDTKIPEDLNNIITITDIQFTRLQDLSDEDCLAEGIIEHTAEIIPNYPPYTQYCCGISEEYYDTPRQAFAKLIDKINGKGTWESNPYVFVYDFELVK